MLKNYFGQAAGWRAGSLRDQEAAYSVSDRQGLNFESCVWRAVSFDSSYSPQPGPV